MKELSEVVRELRQEIEAGLAAGLPLPGVARLEAESVTLTLALVLDSNGASSQPTAAPPRWRPLTTPSATPSAHSVTIQFRVPKAGVAAEITSPDGARTSEPQFPAPRWEVIATRCVPVFGAPGFDNSARAEVFCELVSAHPGAEMIAALAAISGQLQAGLSDPPDRLVLRLRQVLGFAPTGPEGAAVTLLRLFEEFPLKEVVGVIAERWRFGTHWSVPPEMA